MPTHPFALLAVRGVCRLLGLAGPAFPVRTLAPPRDITRCGGRVTQFAAILCVMPPQVDAFSYADSG